MGLSMTVGWGVVPDHPARAPLVIGSEGEIFTKDPFLCILEATGRES